jgi:hypothetical protein
MTKIKTLLFFFFFFFLLIIFFFLILGGDQGLPQSSLLPSLPVTYDTINLDKKSAE